MILFPPSRELAKSHKSILSINLYCLSEHTTLFGVPWRITHAAETYPVPLRVLEHA